MRKEEILELLRAVKSGDVEVQDAFTAIKDLSYEELGYAKIDYHRQIRNGYPEVIYGQGKAPEHLMGILESMEKHHVDTVLATRILPEVADRVLQRFPEMEYHPLAKALTLRRKAYPVQQGKIVICTGGTADIPVAEEAAVTAEIYGNPVERVYDVGVAGLHRLLSKLEIVRAANVVIAVAGMEGALASVIGGLTDKPVIAVPTSVGYGANFGGMSALLAMLNSCASGISVVNIDNGFGAGYLASMINKMNLQERKEEE